MYIAITCFLGLYIINNQSKLPEEYSKHWFTKMRRSSAPSLHNLEAKKKKFSSPLFNEATNPLPINQIQSFEAENCYNEPSSLSPDNSEISRNIILPQCNKEVSFTKDKRISPAKLSSTVGSIIPSFSKKKHIKSNNKKVPQLAQSETKENFEDEGDEKYFSVLW